MHFSYQKLAHIDNFYYLCTKIKTKHKQSTNKIAAKIQQKFKISK